VLAGAQRLRMTLALAATLVLSPSPFHAENPSPSHSIGITALAPIDIIATGFRKPTGLVGTSGNTLVLSDSHTGVLYRLIPTSGTLYRSEVIYAGLEKPWGLVIDHGGELIVAEEQRGRILRFNKIQDLFSAVPEVVAEDLLDPKWLEIDAQGNLYVSASGLARKQKLTPKEDVVLRIAADDRISIVADGFKDLTGLALLDSNLYAAAKRWNRNGQEQDSHENDEQGTIFKLSLPTGIVSSIVEAGFKKPIGLTIDGLGALFISAKLGQEDQRGQQAQEDDDDDNGPLGADQSQGTILKATLKPDGSIQAIKSLASGLRDPAGLMFDAAGNLYVAEQNRGRVVRFNAPATPVLEPPPPTFTNRSSITLRGQAVPGDVVTIVRDRNSIAQASVSTSGAFTLDVPLTANAEQTLSLFATAANGGGLTSLPLAFALMQDQTTPDTIITAGPPETSISRDVSFSFVGSDNLTSPEALEFAWRLDAGPWSTFSAQRSMQLTVLPGSHRFEVKARDLAGNEDETPASQLFTTISGLDLIISEPTGGSSINADRLIMKGTVSGATGEVGVSVNGIPALLAGSQWVAEVPLVVGSNTITVIAIDAVGTQATRNITINVAEARPAPLILRAVPESGVAPLTVTWEVINQTGHKLVKFELDEAGTGSFGQPTGSFDRVRTTYSVPGLQHPHLRALDEQGTAYSATATINVLARDQVDTLLKGKWNGMKAALITNDTEGALGYFNTEQRSRFRTLFTALHSQISQIARDMQEIQLIYVQENRAKYRLRRTQSHGGQLVTATYYVYFVQDASGFWSIEEF
jgi:sugar lactone lactonase YvrE